MFTPKHIGCIIGTRPEVIKMAPIIKALQKDKVFRTTIICSAQHRELLDDTLSVFHLMPDIDLNIMKNNQTISQLSGALCSAFEAVAKQDHYDAWLVQGDTTTTFIASLIAFYHKIPVGHVEAGLRTGDKHEPFPEEMNRILASDLATWHFTPTTDEKDNLIKEGINENTIFVTGNTVIDALYSLGHKNQPIPVGDKKTLLATIHRRENFGEPLLHIFDALKKIACEFSNVDIVYPVHPNPNVKDVAYRELSGYDNIHLIAPQKYEAFCALMEKSYFILTDSGGVQEEAPALGKPVLVLREKTERQLVVTEGGATLVGTDTHTILNAARTLLLDPAAYQQMVKTYSPYGDGKASDRIIHILKSAFTQTSADTLRKFSAKRRDKSASLQ